MFPKQQGPALFRIKTCDNLPDTITYAERKHGSTLHMASLEGQHKMHNYYFGQYF